jgi:two-component system, LytTR family, sensor kinase
MSGKSDAQRPIFMHPVVFLAGWVVLAGLFALQEYVGMRSWNYHVPFDQLFYAWTVHFLLWGIICWMIWWRLREPIQSVGLRCILTRVVPLSILVSVLEEAVWVAVCWNVPIGNHGWTYWHRLTWYLDSELVDNLVIFWVVFLLFRGVGYYQRLREKEYAAIRLQTELTNAQLRALRMQLNPHFLFNTMNSISALMRLDVDAADHMLEQMGSMLRMTLDRGDEPLVPLSQEVEFIQMYLAIQQARFHTIVHQYIAIEPEVLDAMVPTMILQPLVENAYIHGVAKTVGEGFLGIEAQNQDGQLRICVRNSGRGLAEKTLGQRERIGVGVANVKARLELHYGSYQGFSLQEFADGEVQAVLLLPLGFGPRLTAHESSYA